MGVVVAGLLATRISLDEEGGEDPQWIVIDEWAGVCIALIGADPRNLLGVLGALVMFRIFDIVKPGPVSWAEDLPGAWGIMADDVIAGVCALAGMSALRCW
jgi:phosphatidylglycerophosphatase A